LLFISQPITSANLKSYLIPTGTKCLCRRLIPFSLPDDCAERHTA